MKLYFYRYDSTSNTVEITANDYEEVCDEKGKYYVRKNKDVTFAVLDIDLNIISYDYHRQYLHEKSINNETFVAYCYSLDLDVDRFIEDVRNDCLLISKDIVDMAIDITKDCVDIKENV